MFNKNLPITRFEARSSDVGSSRTVNCAKANACATFRHILGGAHCSIALKRPKQFLSGKLFENEDKRKRGRGWPIKTSLIFVHLWVKDHRYF